MPSLKQFLKNEIAAIKNKEGELPTLAISGSLSGSTKSFSITLKQQGKVIDILESFNAVVLSQLARSTINFFCVSKFDTSFGNNNKLSELGALITEITQATNSTAVIKTTLYGNEQQNKDDAYTEIANALIKLLELQTTPVSNKAYKTLLGHKTKVEIGESITLLVKAMHA